MWCPRYTSLFLSLSLLAFGNFFFGSLASESSLSVSGEDPYGDADGAGMRVIAPILKRIQNIFPKSNAFINKLPPRSFQTFVGGALLLLIGVVIGISIATVQKKLKAPKKLKPPFEEELSQTERLKKLAEAKQALKKELIEWERFADSGFNENDYKVKRDKNAQLNLQMKNNIKGMPDGKEPPIHHDLSVEARKTEIWVNQMEPMFSAFDIALYQRSRVVYEFLLKQIMGDMGKAGSQYSSYDVRTNEQVDLAPLSNHIENLKKSNPKSPQLGRAEFFHAHANKLIQTRKDYVTQREAMYAPIREAHAELVALNTPSAMP